MKSLFLNIAALALFSAFAAAADMLTQQTILFQLVAQWLANELWFDACLLPVLLMHLFGRKGEGRGEARLRRAARWTSFCLLLFPALLFAVLTLAESLSSNALSDGLGLPLGSGLYSSSFAAFVLLFILSLVTGAPPLSLQAAFENFVDDKFDDIREEMKADIARSAADSPLSLQPKQTTTLNIGTVSTCHSRLFAAHERDFARKQQAGEQLILTTAPAGAVPMGDEWQNYLFGGGFGLAGIFLLYHAHAWQQTGELAGLTLWLLYLMGAAFVLFALPVFIAPLRWRHRLHGIDYFITNRRLLIYRGDEVYTQSWSEPCICHLTPRAGERGDIAVIRKGMSYHLLRTFFKRWAGVNEEETRLSFDKGTFSNGKDMQTQALLNVEGADAIYALIGRLLNDSQQEQTR